ncbi:MAG: DUF4406 domain-containing protein [Patescibacteria group bacterium]|nr:DUF4406 domain-containing protein [Patescibacteria group bacterium]
MEISKKTKKYWKKEDWEDLNNSKSTDDLYFIAKRIIERMPKPIIQICGPIATGGLGSIKANLEKFNDSIIKLQNEGLNVFDQMPFEDKMQEFKKTEIENSVLNNFYLPIFESKIISTLYFLPNWKTSFGATWEHSKAEELNIEIKYLI